MHRPKEVTVSQTFLRITQETQHNTVKLDTVGVDPNQ